MARSHRTLLVASVVIAFIAGGTWLALPRIAEAVVANRLAAAGLGPTSVRVARLDFTGARIATFSAAGGALSADDVLVRWSPADLEITDVIVSGLRLSARWTGDGGLDLGALDPLLARRGTGREGQPRLPVARLTLADAQLAVALPDGTLRATVDGTIVRDLPGPALDLTARVTAPGLSGTLAFAGTAAGANGATPVSGGGRIDVTAHGFAAPGIAGAIDGSLTGRLEIGADSIVLAAGEPVHATLRDPAPALREALARMVQPAAEDQALVLAFAGPEGAEGPTVAVTGLGDPGGVMVASKGLRAEASYGPAALDLRAAGSARLGGPEATAALKDIAASVEGLVVEGSPLSVTLDEGSVTLNAGGIAAEGTVAAQATDVVLPDASARQVALDARLRLTLDAGMTGALYADRGTLTATGVAAGAATVTEPLTLTLAATEQPLLRLTRPEDAGDEPTARLLAAFAAPTLALALPDLAVRFAFDTMQVEAVAALEGGTLRSATLAASGGTVTAPAVTLTDVTLDAGLGATGPTLSMTGAVARLPGETEALAARSPLRPYTVSLKAEAAETDGATAPDGAGLLPPLSVTLTVRDAGQARLLTASGRVQVAEQQGRLRIDMPRQVFDPQGLRPEHLHGRLGTWAQGVTGSVAVEGTVAWRGGTLDPDLRVLLRDLSLTQGFVTLRRINGVVAFDSLEPLRTKPDQEVSVAVIEAGLPLTDVVAGFQISGGRLHVDNARATLAEGTLTADPTAVPLDLADGGITLRVRDLRVAPLVDLLEVEGLRAGGSLTGGIPLRFAGGDVIIDNAVLRSQAPDRVAYAPAQLPEALSGGGQSVDMAMQALADFRYDTLRLTVDGRASGEMMVTLHIAGANPDFYDGYPVEFNLSVSGELAEVVQAGLRGYRVPERIRERMQRFDQ